MGKRSDERYKLLASTFGSTAVGTAIIGFVRPELEWKTTDPAAIYDPYYSLGIAVLLLMLALGWIGGMADS